MSGVSRSHWMRYAQPERQTLGELFDQPRDVTARKHKGNSESIRAFNTVREMLNESQERVFNCIKASGATGRTNDELCIALGLMANQVSPRLTELRISGRIQKIGTRLTRSKCPAAVWKAV